MDWQNSRLTTRLNRFTIRDIEEIYTLIAQIDAAKNCWFLTRAIPALVIKRLTQSAIIT